MTASLFLSCLLLLAASPAPCAEALNLSPAPVTAHSGVDEQLLYFTSSSLLDDDRRLIFLSERTGNPNLFLRDLRTGEERQLTTNTEGTLRSSAYYNGNPYRGLGKSSVMVDPAKGLVYFVQGRNVCVVDTEGRQRVLALYPDGQVTAGMHLSHDGARLVVPTMDAQAFDVDPGKIDAYVREHHLSSFLRVFDPATGEQVLCERVNAWISHVQFSPIDRNVILYNNERPSDCGIRRIWLWTGKEHRRLRDEGQGRSKDDWTCHEMWERDGKTIIYHGTYVDGRAYLGRVRPDGTGRVEIPLPTGWHRYGHFTVGPSGWLVTDGYYETSADPGPKGSGVWLSLVHVDWDAGKIDWHPLLYHGSSWKSQDAHPHPIFNHTCTAVYFTSDKSGKRAGYRVDVTGVLGQNSTAFEAEAR
jgi:oligogalacturonide lyase